MILIIYFIIITIIQRCQVSVTAISNQSKNQSINYNLSVIYDQPKQEPSVIGVAALTHRNMQELLCTH